jgi:hypothetical protein
MVDFNKAVEAAKDYAEQAEQKADSLLMKLVKSRWTWAILGTLTGLFLLAVFA